MSFQRAILVCILSISTCATADWVRWKGNGHFYMPVEVPAGILWQDAQANAVSSNGYLATVTSEEENSFIFSLIDDLRFWKERGLQPPWGPWIGGFQNPVAVEPTQEWLWVTGEVFEYENWKDGEPNDFGDEEFIHFYTDDLSPSPSWNDLASPSDVLLVGYVVESTVPEIGSFIFGGLSVLSVGGWYVFRCSRCVLSDASITPVLGPCK